MFPSAKEIFDTAKAAHDAKIKSIISDGQIYIKNEILCAARQGRFDIVVDFRPCNSEIIKRLGKKYVPDTDDSIDVTVQANFEYIEEVVVIFADNLRKQGYTVIISLTSFVQFHGKRMKIYWDKITG